MRYKLASNIYTVIMYNNGIELDRKGKWEKLPALFLSLLTEYIMAGDSI